MKKKLAIIASVAVVAVIAIVVIAMVAVKPWSKTFALSDEYCGKSGLVEIDTSELRDLITAKKSFALVIYQPGCITSEDFVKNLTSFSEKEQVQLTKMKFSEAKSSGLVGDLRYYPSVALYHDGELVTFLRTDKNDDMSAYDSEAGFAEWWRRYVK